MIFSSSEHFLKYTYSWIIMKILPFTDDCKTVALAWAVLTVVIISLAAALLYICIEYYKGEPKLALPPYQQGG